MTLKELIKKAKEIILKDGYHMPMLFVETARGVGIGLLDLSAEGATRFLYMRALGQQFARKGKPGEVKQLFMVSEAWMSIPKDGTLPTRRPSQDPDRIEVLIISQLTLANRRTTAVLFEMVRDTSGKLIDLQPVDLPAGQVSAASPLLDGYAQATTPSH